MAKPFDILDTGIPDGTSLIEASAGTGKTFAIVGLVLRAVVEEWVSEVDELLVVTFTIAATEELKARIRTALRSACLVFSGQPGADPKLIPLLERFEERYGHDSASRERAIARLTAAVQQMDEMPVLTIHGFCKRVLERSALESGASFAEEVVENAAELLDRAVADFWHRYGHNDAWLSAHAVELYASGSGDPLLDHLHRIGRHPDTRIVPPARTFEEIQADLEAALRQLLERWDVDEISAMLSGLTWNKGAVFTEEGGARRVAEQVRDAAAGTLVPNLDAVHACTPEQILDRANKVGKNKEKAASTAAHRAFAACAAVMELIDERRKALIQRFVEEVGARFDSLKREAGVVTFDDLLRRLYRALDPASPMRDALIRAIRSEYGLALIDEFQDTDPYQERIFREAFAGRKLLYIGDPKQAIYAFRGADIFTYQRAKEEALAVHSLERNWRSSAALVSAVNAVFSAPEHPFAYPWLSFQRVEAAGNADRHSLDGDGKPALVWWSVSPRSETTAKGKETLKAVTKDDLRTRIPVSVAHEVRQLLAGTTLAGQPLAASNIAVLVRKHDQATAVQAELRRCGIAAVVGKAGNIHESPEMRELERVLIATANPGDRSAVRTALATELWGYSACRIEELDEDEATWLGVLERLAAWSRIWRRKGVLHALNQYIDEEGVVARLLSCVDGERRMTNLRHSLELLHGAEQEGRRVPGELIRWLSLRGRRADEEQQEAQLRLESDASAVQIVTMHACKGLEYDVVFAPYLWEAPEVKDDPLVHVDHEVIYDLGSECLAEHLRLAKAERLSEDLRLAYVALTRARYRCYVVWGAINKTETSALGYLLHGHDAPNGDSTGAHVSAAIAKAKQELLEAPAALACLVAPHSELMCVEPLPEGETDTARTPHATPSNTFQPRTISTEATARLNPWRISSFSSWTADGMMAFHRRDLSDSSERTSLENDFLGFAAGATAGQCLHDILQWSDFASTADERVQTLVLSTLRRYGLEDPARHNRCADPEQTVLQLLVRLATTPLPGADFTLGAIQLQQRLNEWRFLLPLGTAGPRELSRAFQAAAAEPLGSTYATMLRELTSEAIEGFLTGIVDLVFRHEGRWYIVDWKSNLLGYDAASYQPAFLAQPMMEHHYVLQYHLYVLGLHRYLRTRDPGYRYEDHFGGVWYVFLRGVDGISDAGFYHDRPSLALIEALEAALCPAAHV
jgi:exodeoxyribonuclease V beta subunit